MKPFRVPIYPDLHEVGSFMHLTGSLPEGEYHVGHDTFAVDGGISYDVSLTNTGEAILLSGVASTHATGECARCLEPVEFDVKGDVEGYYLLDREADAGDDRAEDEYGYVEDDETVEISDAILAALVLETPLVILCDDQCKGLCPHCGKNLNEGPCGCIDTDGPDPMNPFAVLKDLKLD